MCPAIQWQWPRLTGVDGKVDLVPGNHPVLQSRQIGPECCQYVADRVLLAARDNVDPLRQRPRNRPGPLDPFRDVFGEGPVPIGGIERCDLYRLAGEVDAQHLPQLSRSGITRRESLHRPVNIAGPHDDHVELKEIAVAQRYSLPGQLRNPVKIGRVGRRFFVELPGARDPAEDRARRYLDEAAEIRQRSRDLERVDDAAQVDGDYPLRLAPLAVDPRCNRGGADDAGDTVPRRSRAEPLS